MGREYESFRSRMQTGINMKFDELKKYDFEIHKEEKDRMELVKLLELMERQEQEETETIAALEKLKRYMLAMMMC